MTKPQLVIFAKAPRRGQVKRRLAAGIGDAAATSFYRAALASLLRRLGRDRRWRTVLAATPGASRRRGWPWPRAIALTGQGAGDLGQRMARAFRRARPGPVVIVGADIPDITARNIAAAFRALGRSQAVFGPAPDGGYWLVGLRQGRSVGQLFRNVRWSTRHALADTRANLPRAWAVALVDVLEDIDDEAAFRRWRSRRALHRSL
jgi:hypothetical protein